MASGGFRWLQVASDGLLRRGIFQSRKTAKTLGKTKVFGAFPGCFVSEAALAWKCVPRVQCGCFYFFFYPFLMHFLLFFLHRTALGNGSFRLLFQACFQIAVLRLLLCSEVLPWVRAKHFSHFLLQRVLKIDATSPDQKKPEFSCVLGHKIMQKTPIVVLACKRVPRGQCGFFELLFHTF